MPTFTFAANGSIRASEINTNFTDVETLAKAIGADQLLGGISASQLSDRYNVDTQAIPLLAAKRAYSATGDLASATAADILWTVDPAGTSLGKIKPVLKSGYESFLCAVKFHVIAPDQNGATKWPNIAVYRNSTLLGGGGVDLDVADNFYELSNADPISQPLSAFGNGDYLEFFLGESAAGASGPPRIRGLMVSVTLKHVLVN